MATNPNTKTDEIGVSGTVIYQGIIRKEDYNQKLSGKAGIRNYEIVRRSDATTRAALQVCKLPQIGATWSVEAAKNKDGEVEDQDQFIADFIEYTLFKDEIKFKRFLKELLTCLDFGYSVFEKVFKATTFEGKTLIGLQKLASRKQSTIQYWQMRDGQPGVTQQVDNNTYDIPMEKLAIFTYDKEGENFEGQSLLRPIFKAWDIKDKMELIYAMAGERHAMGIITAKARDQQTITPSDQEKIEDFLSELRANETLHAIVPATAELEMLDMKTGGTRDLLPYLNYLDRRIMAGVLASFMELGGSSGTGAQALSSDLSSFFMKSEEALSDELADYMNEQIVNQLCDLNFSDLPNGYPKIVVTDVADDDMTARVTAITDLVGAGVITKDADIEEYARDMLDLPAMSEETRDAYEHMNDPISEEDQTAIVDKAKETLKSGDVNASLKAARLYRDSLVNNLVLR